MIAQIGGSVFLLRRAIREPGAIDWPRSLLCAAASVTLALAWTTEVNLDLRRALSARRLELEAGRIAYRELPPAALESNAAPIYTSVAARLTGEGCVLDEGKWFDELNPKGKLDTDSKELRAAFAEGASALNELRAATTLPRCLFESATKPEQDDQEPENSVCEGDQLVMMPPARVGRRRQTPQTQLLQTTLAPAKEGIPRFGEVLCGI